MALGDRLLEGRMCILCRCWWVHLDDSSLTFVVIFSQAHRLALQWKGGDGAEAPSLKPTAEAVRMREREQQRTGPARTWKQKQEVKPAEDRETARPPDSTQAAEKRLFVWLGGDGATACPPAFPPVPTHKGRNQCTHSLTCACGHQLLKASCQCPRQDENAAQAEKCIVDVPVSRASGANTKK